MDWRVNTLQLNIQSPSLPLGLSFCFKSLSKQPLKSPLQVDFAMSGYGATIYGLKLSGAGEAYRYGFNGQEKDDEIKGAGNSLSFAFRMHDSRLGRFFAVDPLDKMLPFYSPYHFGGNSPILNLDLEGLEPGPYYLARRHFPIMMGINDGVTASAVKTWSFVTHDAWQGKTWVSAWELYSEFSDMASYGTRASGPSPTPQMDGIANSFEENVINGDSYSRSKALSEFGTDVLTAYIGSKGLGTVAKFSANIVKTPWGLAKQTLTTGALRAAAKAKSGATLYRIGTTGKSAQGAAAQFWSLENPLINPEAYAKKYNIPVENIVNADFIETAVLAEDANFVTREVGTAPGSANIGKGVEVVVDAGGTTNNVVKPIVK